MNTADIRKKLTEYIKVADQKKVEAIYILLQNEVEQAYEWWKNDELSTDFDPWPAEAKHEEHKSVSWKELTDKLSNKL